MPLVAIDWGELVINSRINKKREALYKLSRYFHIPSDFHTIEWMFFFVSELEFTQFNSQQFSWGNVFSILLGWKFCVLNYETTQWPNLQVLLAVSLTSVIYVSIDFRGILMDMT